MNGVSFAAWRGGHYVSLAELLVVLGRLVLRISWQMRIAEVAPGPGSAVIESFKVDKKLGTLALLHLVAPDVQIIDGEIIGYSALDAREPIIVLRAVDSTAWDVETDDPECIAAIRAMYSDAIEIPT